MPNCAIFEFWKLWQSFHVVWLPAPGSMGWTPWCIWVLAGLRATAAMQLALQSFGRTPNCSPFPPFQHQFPLAFYIFPVFSGVFSLPSCFWCPRAQSSAPTRPLLTALSPSFLCLTLSDSPSSSSTNPTPQLALFPNQKLL